MSHISVLLHETVDALLANRDTGIYIDGTFGRGGHTRLLLSKLGPDAQVYGFDGINWRRKPMPTEINAMSSDGMHKWKSLAA